MPVADPPPHYDAKDQRETRRALADALHKLASAPLAPPFYAIQENERNVQSTAFPVGHFHRYGAVGDGVNDDVEAINAAALFAPEGSTLVGLPGATYLLSATPEITKAFTVDGQGATWKAAAALANIGITTDISGMVWQNLHLDGNGLAKGGIRSVAATVAPVGVSVLNCHARNLATDHTLVEAAFHVTSTNPLLRHLYPTIDNCSATDCGTSGAYIYYSDGGKLTNWTGYNLDNHSFEFVFARDFLADTITSSYCGGSGAACGAQSYHGVMKGIVANYCFGDGGITVENTCADVRVSDFMLRNCWKAGLSANFGESGHPFPNDVMRGVVYSNGTARAAAPVTITGATKANPCKLTIPSHGIKTIYLSNTVQVSLAGVVGMTALNGTTPQITTINPVTGIHDPNAVWLLDPATGLGIDSTGYGAYTSGGTMAPFCNGANMYGGVPDVSTNICLRDAEFNDFNCGLHMLYMDTSECRNIRVSGLQGPISAVARFTYFSHGTINGIHNTDQNHQPSDPLGAVQFLNQTGTANTCHRTTATDIDVLQCGPTSNYPLIYVEGSPDLTIDRPTTGGASCVVSTRAAADTATIRITNPSVALSTDTIYVRGAGSTPVLFVDYPRLPRTITATSAGVYYDSVVTADATAAAVDYAPSSYADVIGKRVAVVKVDATANLVTAFGVAMNTQSQSVEAEATLTGWYIVGSHL